MESKYAATYRFPGSRSVVHVVAPLPLTEECKDRILRGFYRTAWAAWSTLTVEQRLKINLRVDLTKTLQRRLKSLKAD